MNDNDDDDDITSTYTESRLETEGKILFVEEEKDDEDDKDDLVEEEDEEVGGNGYRRNNNRKQLSGGKQMMVAVTTTRATTTTTPRPRPPSITDARIEEGLTVEGDDVSAAIEMLVEGTEVADVRKKNKPEDVEKIEFHISRRNEKGKEKLMIPNTRTNMNESEVEAEVKPIIEQQQQQQHHYHPHPSPVFIATGVSFSTIHRVYVEVFVFSIRFCPSLLTKQIVSYLFFFVHTISNSGHNVVL